MTQVQKTSIELTLTMTEYQKEASHLAVSLKAAQRQLTVSEAEAEERIRALKAALDAESSARQFAQEDAVRLTERVGVVEAREAELDRELRAALSASEAKAATLAGHVQELNHDLDSGAYLVWLPIAHCPLPIAHCPLPIAH